MNQKDSQSEAQRLSSSRLELIERIDRLLPEDRILEVFPAITLARSSRPTEPLHSVSTPAFCVIAQGSKEVWLANEVFRYDPGHYLISTVDLPVAGRVLEASEARPYFSFRLDLDPAMVGSIMMEADITINKGDTIVKAMDVSSIDVDLLEAVVRLVRLIDRPAEMNALAPLIMREIVYRLLRGEQAARLRHLVAAEGDTRRISKAIGLMREHFAEQLKIAEIARRLGMSVSGFHHHFKSVTSMSPLQFQKSLRLQEARRLMIGEDLDAASAGFRVGYGDPSHFSREYKKQFGAPPQRDINRLRGDLRVRG